MAESVVAEEGPASAERVMLEILIHGPLSRVELAERLGLSGPSLTRLTKPLLASGRLSEGAPLARAAGRPILPLELDPSAEHFAGAKITATTVYAVVTDLRGVIRAEVELPLAGHGPEVVADAVVGAVRALPDEFAPLSGVGISLGGTSADGRTVRASHFLEWTDVPLADLVEERIGLPVTVANDVNALTQAQHWFGAGRGLDSFVVVTIGAGIGMGVVAGGNVVAGANGAAGSIGHQLLAWSDAVCWRGHHGCASALLSTAAVEAAAARATGAAMDYDAVLLGASRGDPALRAVVDEAAAALGLLLASVTNTLDPQRILLAGEGARLGEVGEHAMLASLTDGTDWEGVRAPVEVQPFAFNEWARGAAATAIRARMLR
ncbi:ROK family transcriptional regulator [Leifsonia shinshuensis]|uniref:ROK family transcriptional regulator n=1 Tax=Leifsonia shinshuensis TaxID=150026 RepID=A0A7G6Y9T3_9MICO|nr:ROK family transcriptional regulator [Leifsonia shinshuensis]QNE35248.1 ROK family transcriptional regulator [Leifsonia shinshuensis]